MSEGTPTSDAPSLARRALNAAVPAFVFAGLLVLAGLYLWSQGKSSGDAARGQLYFERLCLLALSIGLAAFLCRMLAGARSARLGLLRPEPGDAGAVGWFATLVAWGYLHPRPLDEGAGLLDKLVSWIASGMLESPLWVVFGLALAATAILALADLWIRRALASDRQQPRQTSR